MSEENRQRVITRGEVRPTFLVDGFVRGTWSMAGARPVLSPFRPLSRAHTAAVLEEAERLVDFVAAETAGRDVAFV